MITYKDCPECGTRRIHESVRLCEVCEVSEGYEKRLESMRAEVAKYRECLETIHYSFKMGNVVSGPMLQTWAEFIEKALNEESK